MQSGVVSSLSSVLPTSQVFTSGYVNMETILHFFNKITYKRGTKTVFTYAHVKWFHGQSEHAYYLNYFIILHSQTNYSNLLQFHKHRTVLGRLAGDCWLYSKFDLQHIFLPLSTMVGKDELLFQ